MSNNGYPDDASSLTITRNSSLLSDTDSLSDSSKKIRKKRNTYQKISDDIRVLLLEAVQNGETLKAAAKRHKINYSSAKSILHTYRKEGRILKKSAQERTTKKKSPTDSEFKMPSKATKSAKKENVQPDQSGDKGLHSLTVLERTKSEPAHFSVNEKASLISPKEGLKDNHLSMARTHSYEPHHQSVKEEAATLHCGYHASEPTIRPFSVMENDHTHGNDYLHHNNRFSYPKSRFFDYSMSHFEAPFGDMNADHHDHGNHISFTNNADTFHDNLTSPWGFKPTYNEDYYHDHHSFFHRPTNMQNALEDKTNMNGMEYENLGENSTNFPMRSFMDTQKLISELGKASVSGYNGNNSVYRKGSMDFY